MERIKALARLPERPVDAHKGSVGRIALVAGSLADQGMIGAAALAANAALRCGAGLVQVLTPPAAQPFVGLLAPCATTRALPAGAGLAALANAFQADVVAIGPGLGGGVTAGQVSALLAEFDGPVVVDADALNLLADGAAWTVPAPARVVLTPHSGEFSRLVRGWQLQMDGQDRESAAVGLADHTGAVVVLKGRGTVVAAPGKIYVNTTGNAGMATAGAGDVLTGVIAALAGQGLDAFDAAVLGVYLHGVAGDAAASELGQRSMLATDLVDYLPVAIDDVEPFQDDR